MSDQILGSVTFAPSSVEGAMAASIVHLIDRLAEVEAERDFYKAAATKLSESRNGRRKN